jgi:hypothetical protein
MTKFDSWLKVGASWREVSRDYSDIRPKEGFVTYRVIPPEGDLVQIEQQTRNQDGDDTNITCIDDMISNGTLLDADPELSEVVEIEGYDHFVERLEPISLETGSRDCYKLVRKKRDDCERCGGSGDCSDCSTSGECYECGKSGTCGNCSGEGKCGDCDASGKCNYCEGSGRCPSCEGSGNISGQGPCTECEGSGKCTSCHGNGNCQTCKGTARCTECIGSGKCSKCHGTGTCGFCNGTLKCRDCKGNIKTINATEYWYDKASGLLLRYLKSVNGKPIMERKVTFLNISAQSQMQSPSPAYYQPGGALSMEPPTRQPLPAYQNPMTTPAPPPSQMACCPSCGGRLDFGRIMPMFCPHCGSKLR